MESGGKLELFSSVANLLRQANFPNMSGESVMKVAALMAAYESIVNRLLDGELRIEEVKADAAE